MISDEEFESEKLIVIMKHGSMKKAMNDWYRGDLKDKRSIEFFRYVRLQAMKKLEEKHG